MMKLTRWNWMPKNENKSHLIKRPLSKRSGEGEGNQLVGGQRDVTEKTGRTFASLSPLNSLLSMLTVKNRYTHPAGVTAEANIAKAAEAGPSKKRKREELEGDNEKSENGSAVHMGMI